MEQQIVSEIVGVGGWIVKNITYIVGSILGGISYTFRCIRKNSKDITDLQLKVSENHPTKQEMKDEFKEVKEAIHDSEKRTSKTHDRIIDLIKTLKSNDN